MHRPRETRTGMRRTRFGPRASLASALLAAALLGCTRGPGDSTPAGETGGTPAETATVDSIVLERTVCFGFCPAYRLSIGRTGAVLFERQAQRGTPGDTARDTIDPAALSGLLARARDIGFFTLPDDITPANQGACPMAATDHPSAIVTIAIGDTVKRVNHYHGCHAQRGDDLGDAYPELTQLENAIDSAAQVERWLRQRENGQGP